jgi:hypothetical protein
MHDLPQPLLAYLQREARDARVRAGESREANEKRTGKSRQKLNENWTSQETK